MAADIDSIPYYGAPEEVIGSYFKYHRPTCYMINMIERHNLYKFRSWEEAIVANLSPCRICKPFYKSPVKITEAPAKPVSPEKPPYYGDLEEVIGGLAKYHMPSCHMVNKLYKRYKKTYRSWRAAVAAGCEPCGICLPYYESPKVPAPSYEASDNVISIDQLSELRRRVAQLANTVDGATNRPKDENLGQRIARLSWDGSIPRPIAAFMKTITEVRNVAEYSAHIISREESDVVAAANRAIAEWARINNFPY